MWYALKSVVDGWVYEWMRELSNYHYREDHWVHEIITHITPSDFIFPNVE